MPAFIFRRRLNICSIDPLSSFPFPVGSGSVGSFKLNVLWLMDELGISFNSQKVLLSTVSVFCAALQIDDCVSSAEHLFVDARTLSEHTISEGHHGHLDESELLFMKTDT